MAKARAIVKRRKAVRNIKKITKTMQMIATAKFQKSLKRVLSTKPYTLKIGELVNEIAASVDPSTIKHPLLREVKEVKREAVVVITSNRGLCGAYNGHVIRKAMEYLKSVGNRQIDLYCAGKKGAGVFRFSGRKIQSMINVSDVPQYAEVEPVAKMLMEKFIAGEIDAVTLVYMNFISTGVQRADVKPLLPLDNISSSLDQVAQDMAEKEAQIKAGALDAKRKGADVQKTEFAKPTSKVEYEFAPSATDLLGELLPLTVKTAFFQAFLDATTSEHVARMVAMKSASDNADKMAKSLSLQYNRARQSQITTELSEIMGGVEAMK
jgi:F-type H+-transporting ATPase subunit gamma